jgi:hypothetical protein
LTSLGSLPILPLKMLPPFQVNRSAHPGVPTDVVALAWGFLCWRNGCWPHEARTRSRLLGYFDSSSGIRPIVAKLPYALQEKWTSRASSYIERYGVAYPPFVEFVSFIRQISKTKNHPGFMYDLETTTNTKTLGKQQFPCDTTVSAFMWIGSATLVTNIVFLQ